MSIVAKREVEATLKEELDKKHRCMKCKHYSARALFSDLPEPIIQGTCTKCDKDIVANDPANEVPYWCPGYETLDKKYIKCPVCGGSGVKEYGLNGHSLACETCHGDGILEEKTMDLENVNEPMNVKVDPTNPDHYKNHTSLECIEEMEIIFGPLGITYFCVCNAWKYIWRWKNKNGIEDLKKAKWYIEKAWELMDEGEFLKPAGLANLLTRMSDYIVKVERKLNKENTNED